MTGKSITVLSAEYLFLSSWWSADSLQVPWLCPALSRPVDNAFFSPLTSSLQLHGPGNTNHTEPGSAVAQHVLPRRWGSGGGSTLNKGRSRSLPSNSKAQL